MRVMPHQVVALPTVKLSLCPVLAWKGYVKARRGRGERGDPVFRWKDGKNFSTRDLGRILWEMSRVGERVTPRDLRAGMPTLLARRGVKEGGNREHLLIMFGGEGKITGGNRGMC